MEENSQKGLQKFSDEIENAITRIPSPIRRNFLKAFKQLCITAIATPTTWLEEKTAELRNTSENRIQLLKNQSEITNDEIQIQGEFPAKASAKYTSKIIREQVNLDDITLNAANELAKDIINKESREAENAPNQTKEIEDDWLNEFESHARLKSSEDMKLIFGKILSGEISKPGSFSIRTVRLISQLDKGVAKLFQILCSKFNIVTFWEYAF